MNRVNGTTGAAPSSNGHTPETMPPHNPAAERAVLGSMLRDNGVIETVAKLLNAGDFYADAHQKVYQAVLSLWERGGAVDLVLLTEELKARDQIGDMGGYAYLAELWDAAPTAANVVHYAGIVRDKATRRETIRLSTTLTNEAPGCPPGRIIELADRLAATAGPGRDRSAPVIMRLSDVPIEPVLWLWEPWIPRGTLTVLDGDPSLGKSTITLDLAARVTRGWPMPPGHGSAVVREPAGVLLMTAEDSIGRTVRPRLEAAGGDPKRCHVLTELRLGRHGRPPVLPDDLPLIVSMIRDLDIRLFTADPFSAFLGSEYDAHKDQDIRRALYRLAAFAEETDVALVLVRHLNKLNGGAALYRGGGSIAILGAARAALIVGRDPADPTVHVLAMNKSNLGPTPRSLRYAVEQIGGAGITRIGWEGECDLAPDDILFHGSQKGPGRPRSGAVAWIKEVLAKGPLASKEFFAQGKAAGYSERTLKRARKEVGAIALKDRFDGDWSVALPSATMDAAEVAANLWPDEQGHNEQGQNMQPGHNSGGSVDNGPLAENGKNMPPQDAY